MFFFKKIRKNSLKLKKFKIPLSVNFLYTFSGYTCQISGLQLQCSLLDGFAKSEKDTKRKMTRKKFEVAYVVCKEEFTSTKYPIFLALEEHGVEIGTAYRRVLRAHICRLYRLWYNWCIERQG